MKTFLVRDGDLVIGPGGFATVSGHAKVRQDLGMASIEPLGGDRFHPRWGSELPGMVGRTIDEDTRLLIRSEIRRIVANYMAVQQSLIEQDRVQGNRSRFGSGEVVAGIDSIAIQQEYDRLRAKVTVQTMAGTPVTLAASVGV